MGNIKLNIISYFESHTVGKNLVIDSEINNLYSGSALKSTIMAALDPTSIRDFMYCVYLKLCAK